MDAARRILTVLDENLVGPGTLRLLGGAALIVGYGLRRTTEDVDLVMDSDEVQVLIDEAGLSEALERTNALLEPEGLYLTNIWGPEQQILTPSWRENCRRVPVEGLSKLSVFVLGPIDLIASKMCRADALDLDDVEFLVRREQLDAVVLLDVLRREARVPTEFRSFWPEALARLARRLSVPPTEPS